MSKIERYTRKKRNKYQLKKIDRDLRKEYGIKEKSHGLKMVQYSKILTTVIMIFTIIINAFYYIYIVPHTGDLGITDAAMEYSSGVLKIWDSGTIIFFCGYFAKSLFETKFERDSNTKAEISKASKLSEKVMEEVEEVLDDIH